MSQPQHLECDTPDCIHWKDGECIKETSVTIQEHHCVDYEQHVELPTATVTIEVSGGVVQNVYASPDLLDISVELIDFDNLRDEPETVEAHSQRMSPIIKIIVTVFSLGNKVTVFQSVKWRYCAVWHFFCFLPAKMRVEINYFNGREGPAERGITSC